MNLLHRFQEIFSLYLVVPASVFGFFLCFLGLFYSEKLKNYLIVNKPERWEELRGTAIFGTKFRTRNGDKFFKYIFGTLDDDDQNLLRLKLEIRKFIKLGLFLSIVPISLFFLLYVVCLF